MKVYHVTDICKDVRVALDQNKLSGTLAAFSDVDTLSVDQIIISKILDGVHSVHGVAPAYLLDGGYNFGDSLHWEGYDSGWCLLPENFMRLVVFKMSDWERAVYHPLHVDDVDYQKQHSRYKGIRGNPQKPVCAIGIRPEGRILEFYSCKNNFATVERAVYLPYSFIDDDQGVKICQRCYPAVVYAIAGLTATALNNIEQSKILYELSKSVLK